MALLYSKSTKWKFEGVSTANDAFEKYKYSEWSEKIQNSFEKYFYIPKGKS